MKNLILFFLLACVGASASEPAASKGKAERVVVVVWDGMRPDMISPERTPTLSALAKEGVFFKNHHAVYLAATEVNGTALATGMYPAHSGVMANREFRPEIDPLRAFPTQDAVAMRKGDALGRYLAAPTLAEILQSAGLRTAVAGTKPVALMQDRSEVRASDAAKSSVVSFEGTTLPERAGKNVEQSIGAFPSTVSFPNTAQDAWATRALTEVFWKEDVPRFSMLWLSEPDYSQHRAGPGSPLALAALGSCDAQLASVLAALDARGLRETTDVLVVSDHGFSTISRSVDVVTILGEEGFYVWKNKFEHPPAPGDILAVGNGGSVLFYIAGHSDQTTRQLVEFLQRSDFAGVIFTRKAFEGTFPLTQARIDTASAPDIVMAFRWAKTPNQFGTPGLINADWNRAAGQGTHATLSPFELHNTLVAAGPDFGRGMTGAMPTGNVDIAPTVLWILGVKQPSPMDGRVLFEAMPAVDGDRPQVRHLHAEAVRAFDDAHWEQSLKWSEVGRTIYLDEGNGTCVEE